MLTSIARLRHPQRLRAARLPTRSGLSSMLRLARPSAFHAPTIVQASVGARAEFITPLYPADAR